MHIHYIKRYVYYMHVKKNTFFLLTSPVHLWGRLTKWQRQLGSYTAFISYTVNEEITKIVQKLYDNVII